MHLISFEYALFLIFVIIGTALLKKRDLQIIFLLFASYYFYIMTSGILVLALIFVTGLTFFCGRRIQQESERKKKNIYLFLALIGALGQLIFFKYLGLSSEISNLMQSSSDYGIPLESSNLLIPLGISFFTFQSLSYVFDIYQGKLKPASSFRDYVLYVSFFPQIASGPIVRAKDFLSQLQAKINLDIEAQNLKYGISLIGIGLIKKMVIADNISSYVDAVFAHPTNYGSLRIIAATVAFGIQLYCDFSGYCDIAIGIARILGFRYPINFNNPYLALNPSDFWHRWNISLSSFLRDYLYIPLGGNRKGEVRTHANLIITMTICGLWHGATWNFIIWGIYQGILLSIDRLLRVNFKLFRRLENKHMWIALQVLITQIFIFMGWQIFRVNNLSDLIYCINKSIFWDFLTRMHYTNLVLSFFKESSIFIIALLFYVSLLVFYRDWFIEKDWINIINSLELKYWLLYLLAVILIVTWFSPSTGSNFIYSAF